MNWKNILSLVGGVTSTAISGIDEAASVIGFIIALLSLLLIVWDLISRIITASTIRSKALEDGIITEDEQKQIDKAEGEVKKTYEELVDKAQDLRKDK